MWRISEIIDDLLRLIWLATPKLDEYVSLVWQKEFYLLQ